MLVIVSCTSLLTTWRAAVDLVAVGLAVVAAQCLGALLGERTVRPVDGGRFLLLDGRDQFIVGQLGHGPVSSGAPAREAAPVVRSALPAGPPGRPVPAPSQWQR